MVPRMARKDVGNPFLTAGALAVAGLFVVYPIVDVVLQSWPPRMGMASWRYGIVGLGANYLITAVFGVIVAVLIAAWREHRRTLYGLAGVSAVGTLLLLLSAGAFALDVLQLRRNVPPEAAWMFKAGAAKAFVKYLTSALVLALAAAASWREARKLSPAAADENVPLIRNA
jgi:hypothetical protein